MYYDSDSGILKSSPSDLTVFMETEFGSGMDRWQAERWKKNGEVAGVYGLPVAMKLPGVDECEPDKNDEQLELIAAMGIAHERAFL